MHVSLTPELEEYVHNKVNTGRYSSASEVVREGLRLLEEQDRIKTLRREELRKKIQVGIDELDAGLGKELDIHEIISEVKERDAKRTRK